jgi:lipopolysaccharide export system permease protein
MTTIDLANAPTPRNLAELSWRAGLGLAAFNFILIAVAAAGVNPRVGRTANLGFAFMAFVVYFNLLVLGKSWIEGGQISLVAFLIVLHGGAFALAALWLAKRHNNWTLRGPRRNKFVQNAAEPSV